MRLQHPLKILSYSAKNLWLLIFPLIRGLLSIRLGDTQAFIEWLQGAWFDILTLVVIILMGCVRWNCSQYTIDGKSLVFLNGVIFRTKTVIPLKSLSSITEEKLVYLRPFKATRLFVDTRAGTVKSDLTLLVTHKDLAYIRQSLANDDITINSEKAFEYKPHFWHTFFFSFVFSNTLSGAIYIFIFLFKSGSILEQLLERSVIDEFNLVTENIANMLMLNVSPIFVGLALIIAFSWLLSFITNIVRYTKFKIVKNTKGVFISTGVFNKHRYKIYENMVNYADLCQSLITKVFKFVSINVNCSGYGSKNEEIPVFIPIMGRKDCQGTISAIMPNMNIYPNNYKPKLTNFWRYTYSAIIPSVVVLIGYFLGVHYFPNAKTMLSFLTLMIEIPIVWYLIVSIISLCTSGFSLKDNQLCIRYSKGYTFHTILVSDVKVAKVTITQTVFQQYSDTYNLIFYLTTEQSQGHKVMGMPRSAIEPFI